MCYITAKSCVSLRIAVARRDWAWRGLFTGVAMVTGLARSNGLAVVSNKSLSDQYFIHCLFRGHYDIMGRLRPVLRRPSLFPNR